MKNEKKSGKFCAISISIRNFSTSFCVRTEISIFFKCTRVKKGKQKGEKKMHLGSVLENDRIVRIESSGICAIYVNFNPTDGEQRFSRFIFFERI